MASSSVRRALNRASDRFAAATATRTSLSRRNGLAATTAAVVVSVVVVVANLGGAISFVTALVVAYALALAILAAGVRPASERRRAIALLLGTGTGWLILWKCIWMVLSIDRFAMPSLISPRLLHSDIPLCALGVGTLFGRVAYVKGKSLLTKWSYGLLYGLGSGFALLGLAFVVPMALLMAGDNSFGAADAATGFIPASAITGIIWSVGFRWYHERHRAWAHD
jgi:hypothetical protein